MKNILIRYLLVFAIMVAMTLNFVACTKDNSPSQSPNTTSTSIIPSISNSEKYHVEVQLPSGWVRVEGPESLVITSHITGEVAFNNWGQKDFWAREIIEKNPDGSIKSAHLGPGDVASQVPKGGSYVALESIYAQPPQPEENTIMEYALNDLSGLYQPHDWREGTSNYAYYKNFFKGGSWYALVIVCKQTATDETVEQLNALLKSWKFR